MEAFPLPFELPDRPFATDLGPVAAFPRFATAGRPPSSSSEDIGIASTGLNLFPTVSGDAAIFLRLLDDPALGSDAVRATNWGDCV